MYELKCNFSLFGNPIIVYIYIYIPLICISGIKQERLDLGNFFVMITRIFWLLISISYLYVFFSFSQIFQVLKMSNL